MNPWPICKKTESKKRNQKKQNQKNALKLFLQSRRPLLAMHSHRPLIAMWFRRGIICVAIILMSNRDVSDRDRHSCVYCSEKTSQETYVDCVYDRGLWDCAAHKYICNRCSLFKQMWILANKINEELGFDYL